MIVRDWSQAAWGRAPKFFQWLSPGLRLKRWILLTALGLFLVGVGSVEFLLREEWLGRLIGGGILVLGVYLVIRGIRKLVKSVVTVFVPDEEPDVVGLVYQKRQLERGPKVVVIGGGTGLSVLLSGLKTYTSKLTAVVTVADDGGSSGRLRDQLNVLPPGDIRNCLVALADAEPLMRELFQFRFGEGSDLNGHNFGNLFITALSKITGDFERAIKESSKVLAIRGRVLPSTLQRVTLVAEHEDGHLTYGESRIPKAKAPIKRIALRPNDCQPTQEALDAIQAADAVILGPGSLYTSIIPNVLVPGIRQALEQTPAVKIYVCNVMTQSGETDGFKASDHVEALTQHAGPRVVDVVITNTTEIPEEVQLRYRAEDAFPVVGDAQRIHAMGYQVVEAPILNATNVVRHHPERLAKIVMGLVAPARGKVRR